MSKNIWGQKELAKWYWLLKYDMHIRVASWDNLFLQGKIKWRETVASEKKKMFLSCNGVGKYAYITS